MKPKICPWVASRVATRPHFTPQQAGALGPDASALTTPETTQGQMHGFFSQLAFKCYLPEVASVGD